MYLLVLYTVLNLVYLCSVHLLMCTVASDWTHDVLDLDLIVLLWVPMWPFCAWFFCDYGLYIWCTSDFLYACPKC